ncbi:MAG: efflux RND transporter periplasmic adaptor subunit [Candidatus Eisenbacteria bacterium]|uniref:Efflux RND transporter periplasmic adaptor subunit n=1 Tax=Eiseniibacteriota bacterium TaxID=2212470 RepID=A0A956NEZ1_UNCEI|nr:efflux RND transporter periplasmic adaptor subunit [Candidatus Eisenbacteria bacterium]MCB9464959.1 efflux RND transporter periplasmic adaptor subunit [Candidatus Eisenbacteria bacterium]
MSAVIRNESEAVSSGAERFSNQTELEESIMPLRSDRSVRSVRSDHVRSDRAAWRVRDASLSSTRGRPSRAGASLLLAAFVAGASVFGAGCSRDANSQNGEASTQSESGTSTAAGNGYVEPPRNVRVLTLERGDITDFLVLSGPLRPVRGADISAEESGVVSQVVRDKGAYVKRGEAILTLDRRILEAEKKSAEASETLNSFNEERTEKLFEENSVSGQEMLLVHTQAAQAKAQADIARLRLEKASFPSPFAGIVSERYVEVGELVAPGTRVARIIDPFHLELEGAITEREVAYVNKGATVLVVLEGLAEPVTGEVTWVGFEADPTNGKFPVEVTVENKDLDLRPGLLGRARIEKQTIVDAVVIPRDAVLSTSEGPTVFIAENGKARRRSVGLGIDQGTLVEVRSGLDAGDELVVRGHRDLADGSPVAIQERATNRDGSISSDPSVVRQSAAGGNIGTDRSGGTR